MKIKKQERIVFEIFIITILAVVVVAALWYAAVSEINNHKENTINAFLKQQYSENSNLADKVKIVMEGYMKDYKLDLKSTEKNIIKNVIKKETNSNNKYIFFYDTNHVVFEKSDSNTKKYSDKTLTEVFNLWEYNGGNNLDDLKKLINTKQDGTAEIMKDSKNGSEILSWCFFKVSNKTYILGMSTSESYLLNDISFDKHVVRFYTFILIFTMMFAATFIAFVLYIFFSHKKVSELKKELQNRRIQIEEAASKLKEMEQSLKRASVYDAVTKVYNRQFLHILLSKINSELFFPIAIIVINIEGIQKINKTFGHNKGDEALIKTAELLKEYCGQNNIISRINDDEFALVLVSINERDAYKILDELQDKIENSCIEILCKFTFGIAIKNDENDDIFDVLSTAKKSVREQKRGWSEYF
ncbi:GGDEF domain-containing protein [Clostridium guangxiense]|uniref:GGDEF domain-containing protein n=1 Tax=Clostridium guangxiense TaxID=1662055 RepID=UPI001E4009C0|nr:GGDEF domain-containing protein [Clostridium guangxiense]MCD2346182.1 GGDEF domain-containing protein [Clostridium guangxiense]